MRIRYKTRALSRALQIGDTVEVCINRLPDSERDVLPPYKNGYQFKIDRIFTPEASNLIYEHLGTFCYFPKADTGVYARHLKLVKRYEN